MFCSYLHPDINKPIVEKKHLEDNQKSKNTD